jgi:hypothetical protein
VKQLVIVFRNDEIIVKVPMAIGLWFQPGTTKYSALLPQLQWIIQSCLVREGYDLETMKYENISVVS